MFLIKDVLYYNANLCTYISFFRNLLITDSILCFHIFLLHMISAFNDDKSILVKQNYKYFLFSHVKHFKESKELP